MLDNAQAFLAWIAERPWLALVLLFSVSALDALFIVGAFVPASIVLFGIGALVALGTLELWPTAAVAAAGALTGDGLSFWLGRHYGDRLFESKMVARYPEMLAAGRAFFNRHGGKGVWLARFLGPVRAITPAMAGASGMPAWLFLLADASAAYLWALVYILPGVLFGASIGLAAEVATRLAGLLVLCFGIGALIVWLMPMLIAALQNRAEQWVGPMLDWSRRHRNLGRFGLALADPDQPETPALALVALSLAVIGGFWLFVLAYVGNHPYPSPIDALIYQTLHDLQTPWGNALAYAVAQLGSPWVYGPTALAVLGTLLARRKHRAAAHWIAALAFGAAISAGLHAVPIRPAPANYFHGIGAAALPRDLMMVVVIYGFGAVLFATQRAPRVRQQVYVSSVVLLALIVLARLYLGVEWWSLSLLSIVVGLLWIGALGLGYRRHRPDRLFAPGFMVPVMLVFLVATGARLYTDQPLPDRPVAASRIHTLAATLWWSGGWTQLPLQRVDLRGRSGDPFDLQWAGDLDQIEQALRHAGWGSLPHLSGSNLLRWLSTSSPVDLLPVLPLVHAGSHQRLALRRPIPDGGSSTDRQQVIRLWPSGWQLDDGRPVWLGSLSSQDARTFYRLFRYPVTDRGVLQDFDAPPPFQQRQVTSGIDTLWLIGQIVGTPDASVYTAPYRDDAAQAPQPVPVPAPY